MISERGSAKFRVLNVLVHQPEYDERHASKRQRFLFNVKAAMWWYVAGFEKRGNITHE